MNVLQKLMLLAGCVLLPTLATAQTPMSYTDQGQPIFTIDVPDFWVVRTGGPRDIEDTQLGDARAVSRVMGLRPEADDGVWMGFVSPQGVTTIAEGVEYLADIDKFLTRDPVISSRTSARIGGRPAEVIRGSGRRDGRDITFTAAVIDLPGPRVAVAVSILAAGADPAYVTDLNAVFGSFRAAR